MKSNNKNWKLIVFEHYEIGVYSFSSSWTACFVILIFQRFIELHCTIADRCTDKSTRPCTTMSLSCQFCAFVFLVKLNACISCDLDYNGNNSRRKFGWRLKINQYQNFVKSTTDQKFHLDNFPPCYNQLEVLQSSPAAAKTFGSSFWKSWVLWRHAFYKNRFAKA